MNLRRDRPYGIVYSHPDIAFEQDGNHFRPDGTLYDLEAATIKDDQDTVEHLDTAKEALDHVRQKRSEAIKAGLARRKAQQGL